MKNKKKLWTIVISVVLIFIFAGCVFYFGFPKVSTNSAEILNSRLENYTTYAFEGRMYIPHLSSTLPSRESMPYYTISKTAFGVVEEAGDVSNSLALEANPEYLETEANLLSLLKHTTLHNFFYWEETAALLRFWRYKEIAAFEVQYEESFYDGYILLFADEDVFLSSGYSNKSGWGWIVQLTPVV